VSIFVSDELSDAAKAQGTVTTAVGVGVGVSSTDDQGNTVGVGVAVAQAQTTPKNILTVEYMFNGQKLRKQAAEGTQLVLP
jgi:hypothetical protein